MKILIIGYGSIGARHTRILKSIGHDVCVVSSRDIDQTPAVKSLADGLKTNPDYIVIASKTSDHLSDLNQIQESGFKGTVLVEKPIFSNLPTPAPTYNFKLFVGYHFRFHPAIEVLRKHLEGQKILSAHNYVGQHLSTWRKDRDHRQTYSAHRDQGGGVLHDLSHDLDLLQFFFGPTRNFHAIGGRFADITIDSDDVYGFVLSQQNCPVVTLQMNYVDHVGQRNLHINTDQNTYHIDMVNNILSINGKITEFAKDYDAPYATMHQAALSNQNNLCTYDQGLNIMRLIDQAEKTNQPQPGKFGT